MNGKLHIRWLLPKTLECFGKNELLQRHTALQGEKLKKSIGRRRDVEILLYEETLKVTGE